MVFKKHDWIHYGRTGDRVKIEVTDCTGRVIDKFSCNDKEDYKKIVKILNDSYGFSPEIPIEKSPNYDDELQWLNKHKDKNWLD